MQKERQVALIERLLAAMERGEPEATCREATLDVERYTSAAWLADERRVLFRELPLVVGREADVAEPGSFFTHDDAGLPILVTRDAGGRLHAMLNVCRHRGTRLVTLERGTAKAFVCPYHAWTYDTGGRLAHVPAERCFPGLVREERGLVEMPCATRHGFVWVRPEGGALDVGAWLGDFDDDLAAFGLAEHVVFARSTKARAANWKLVMDAFLEGYHVKSLHQRTLARFFVDDAILDTSGSHVRSVGARKNLRELAAAPRERWDVRDATTVFYTLFPNQVLVFHPVLVSHIALWPRALDGLTFVHTLLAPRAPKDEAERAAWQRTWELIDGEVFAKEDLAVAESIQSVLHAHAQRTFALGANEHAIAFFHGEVARAVRARS
jgi:Rieske 2Fe-2S family protein